MRCQFHFKIMADETLPKLSPKSCMGILAVWGVAPSYMNHCLNLIMVLTLLKLSPSERPLICFTNFKTPYVRTVYIQRLENYFSVSIFRDHIRYFCLEGKFKIKRQMIWTHRLLHEIIMKYDFFTKFLTSGSWGIWWNKYDSKKTSAE